MKKLSLIILFIFLVSMPVFAWGKKYKPVLILSDSLSSISNNEAKNVFGTNRRIYFSISNPKGFKSDYIKYQIVKQEDNAHIGGLSRVRNVTCREKNKNSYTDYFIVTQKGKYFIQIFDITNLQQWLAIEGFIVIDE